MTVYISGGSNSIMKGGWTEYFVPPDGCTVKNISVGASPSIMGYYRLVSDTKLKAGDTFIWEYALNDSNHLNDKTRHYNENLILSFVERIIRHCADHDVHFIAIVLTPKGCEKVPEMDTYRRQLLSLFDVYEVSYAEISTEMRAKLQVKTLPDTCFSNPNHFLSHGEVVIHTAERATTMAAEKSSVPLKLPKTVFAQTSRAIRLHTTFETGERATFANSLLNVEGTKLGDTPIKLPPMDSDCELLFMFLISAFNLAPIEMRIEHDENSDEVYSLPVGYKRYKIAKPYLGMLSFISTCKHPLPLRRGDQVSLARENNASRRNIVLRDHGRASGPKEISDSNLLVLALLTLEGRSSSLEREDVISGISEIKKPPTRKAIQMSETKMKVNLTDDQKKVRKAMIRAMWKVNSSEMEFASPEAKTAAFQEQRPLYVQKATRMIRLLEKSGVTFNAPAA